jgi:hypothetical protein
VPGTQKEPLKPTLLPCRVTGLLGNMDMLITNGGPPYNSHDFKKYMEKKGIKHHLCTPENPMANGMGEELASLPQEIRGDFFDWRRRRRPMKTQKGSY